MHQPALLFLDEPTAGVDPVARRGFWTLIHELARGGVTVFAATHYLDEAEHATRVGMIYDGLSTPADRKARHLSGSLLGMACGDLPLAVALLRRLPGVAHVTLYGDMIHVLTPSGDAAAVRAALEGAGVAVGSVVPLPPTLEDVFISLME